MVRAAKRTVSINPSYVLVTRSQERWSPSLSSVFASLHSSVLQTLNSLGCFHLLYIITAAHSAYPDPTTHHPQLSTQVFHHTQRRPAPYSTAHLDISLRFHRLLRPHTHRYIRHRPQHIPRATDHHQVHTAHHHHLVLSAYTSRVQVRAVQFPHQATLLALRQQALLEVGRSPISHLPARSPVAMVQVEARPALSRHRQPQATQ